MKIAAPVSCPDEVEMLVANGADELYCGLVPPAWTRSFTGALSPNRRSGPGANLESVEALARLVGAAHAAGVCVHLTLNAPSYNAAQLAHLTELARRAVEVGVDGFIVSDLALLLTLADGNLGATLHVSSVATALNREAMAFYRELGASRIILPRSLSVSAIAVLAAAADRPELEVFVLNDGCPFEEGLCHTLHHHRLGAFCTSVAGWEVDMERTDGRPLSPDEADRVATHLGRWSTWIRWLGGGGGAVSPRGLPYGPCGLCAIPAFRQAGIAVLKIAGRQAPAFHKLMSVRLVKEVLALAERGASADEVACRARAIRATPALCDRRVLCYYRDVPHPARGHGVDA